ncbi:mechanosensitive ion channel-like protein [Micromonospora pisi]|uniref:Mechanosensitive ion channel-like protein n=1 Tax=Micromonospora pisi TaxID=589240 RepID=A0A495JSR1_9ACTN|nr:mechanosensitive ion channel-like protein [Micromonospora pisi]
MPEYAETIATGLGAAAIALLVAEVLYRAMHWLGRRSLLLIELAEHGHRPFQVAGTIFAVQVGLRHSTGYAEDAEWRHALLHVLVLGTIAGAAWLVGAVLLAAEDTALARFRTDVPDNRQARRIKTQVVMLRRVTIAVIVVLALGATLMTFPSVRGVGASVLASAGVIGVVAALAAQTVLGNVFAGIQLAFSDAVRLDDVVVVEGEWGRIEELTLSYVVVQIWDDRRLILPTSYFTSKPFQNWTRTKAAVLGTAEFDVDWSVPVQLMREELRRLVEGTELWDGRVCVLQVTDAVGGLVRVRALVSAADAPSLWDLRCLVREHLVAWIRDQRPIALPRTRAEVGGASGGFDWLDVSTTGRGRSASAAEAPDDARVFGGSDDGDARSSTFVGPDEPVDPGPPAGHLNGADLGPRNGDAGPPKG